MSNSLPAEITSVEQLVPFIDSVRLVVALFYSTSSTESQQISEPFESLSQSLTRGDFIKFVRVDHDAHAAVSEVWGVTSAPTFVIWWDGAVLKRVQGANTAELHAVLSKLVKDIQSEAAGASEGASGTGSGTPWKGAEIPRGYSDITDQIETRNCELLNADEDAGPVKVLFEKSKPSALGTGKASSPDWVQSGSDDQLLLFIPFQSSIKLHTLQITSLPPADEDDAPSRPEVIHLYINRPQNIDFDEADDIEPTQAITLTDKDWNADGTANVSLRYVKFQKTTTLIVYVQKGAGDAETVRLDRVKLIGEAGAKREMGKLQKVGEEE